MAIVVSVAVSDLVAMAEAREQYEREQQTIPEGYEEELHHISLAFPEETDQALRKQREDEMNPATVELRPSNHPRPFTGPDPKVTIPYTGFPHIIQEVVQFIDSKSSLLAFRTTNKHFLKVVDTILAKHIVITSSSLELTIRSRHWGTIPGFRFAGHVMLGTSFSDRILDKMTLEVLADYLQESVTCDLHSSCIDAWFKVHPEAVHWFKGFMSQVEIVDLNGTTAGYTNTLPFRRAQQAVRYLEQTRAHRRVFVGQFPVKIVRMTPDHRGRYWRANPFKPKAIEHRILIKEPFNQTWLKTMPKVPEGVEKFLATIEVDPEACYNFRDPSSYRHNFLIYPDSCKIVIIDPKLLAPQGSISDKTLVTLRDSLMLLFYYCRDPGLCVILNIHRWGDEDQDLIRPLLSTFAFLWYRYCPPSTDHAELKEIMKDRLMFVRYDGDPLELDPAQFTYHHPDGTLSIPEP